MPKSASQMPLLRDVLIDSAGTMVTPSAEIAQTQAALNRMFRTTLVLPDLYYATSDFADLYTEMRATYDRDDWRSLIKDVQREVGSHGIIVVGFDHFHPPTVGIPVYGQDLDQVEVRQHMLQDPSSTFHFTLMGEEERDHFVDIVTNGPKSDADMTWLYDHNWMAQTKAEGLLLYWNLDADDRIIFYAVLLTTTDLLWSSLGDSHLNEDAALILWLLMNPTTQFVQVQEKEAGAGLPPKAKKDMGKKDSREKVRVVSLRKKVKVGLHEVQRTESEQSHGRLQHRFIVRGHWRKQACGTGWKEHKNIYIAPFVKGPEDAPFMRSEKVLKW